MVVGGRGRAEGTGLSRRDASSSWMRQLNRLLQRKSSPSPVTKEDRGGTEGLMEAELRRG